MHSISSGAAQARSSPVRKHSEVSVASRPYPRRDSNPDLSDFKSPASADWATGARAPSLETGRAGPVRHASR